MEFQTETGRIWLADARGAVIAEVLFPDAGDGVVELTRTFVDDSLRGQGVAGKLMEAFAAEMRRQGKRAKLTCPYAVGWFETHDGYGNILV
ncbi:MAG: GNAT family N-acetyltransferase [Oscillospiraceae bacterium]